MNSRDRLKALEDCGWRQELTEEEWCALAGRLESHDSDSSEGYARHLEVAFFGYSLEDIDEYGPDPYEMSVHKILEQYADNWLLHRACSPMAPQVLA